MKHTIPTPSARSFIQIIASLLLALLLSVPAALLAGTQSGVVYVMSNRAKQNSVFTFERAADGTLSFVGETPSGGMGTGVTLDPLQSQGALALRADGKLLLAVNPASGDLSAFRVTASGLKFASKKTTNGALPVSVTVHGNHVYVLNQLGSANISGFTVSDTGLLAPLSASTRELAGGPLAQPAQVSFTPDGSQLIVTEKGTHLLDTFLVQPDGRPAGPAVQRSSGRTPFGFAFGPSGSVIVTEVENRLPMKATVSSYLTTEGALEAVSAAVPNKQSAACWVATTGHTAWVVNTGTATISAYDIANDGSLTLLDPVAATTSDATSPIDLAASQDGKFLYVLKSATGEIAAFRIDGSSLTPLFTLGGLPPSIQGIVAR